MASAAKHPLQTANWPKAGFFALIFITFVAVMWVDDRFWFDPSDPHSRRIAAYRGLLMMHGLLGFAALTAGTLQMSSRIRTRRPALHRLLGKIYLAAVCLSAPLAITIGVSPLEPVTIHVEQVFQGSLWAVCAVIADAAARVRKMTLHRDWMIRSYAFTLVFVTSRLPDIIWSHTSDQFEADLLWSLVVLALLAPDLVTWIAAMRRAGARQRVV